MNSLHGRLIHYNELEMYKKELSRRNYEFDRSKEQYNKKVLFMPIDVKEENLQDGDYTKAVYKVILFGVLENGSKASVILNGIKPFIEIQVPKNQKPENFCNILIDELKMLDNKLYTEITGKKTNDYFNVDIYPETEITYGKYFKLFAEEKSAFIRLYFYKLTARKYAITYLVKKGYQVVHDDINNYYRIVCRDYLISFNTWCVLTNYSRFTDHKRIKGVVFSLDILNYKKYSGEITQQLQKDPTLSMCWDCEMYKQYDSNDKGAPTYLNLDHKLFMIGTTFQWYYQQNQILRICFIDKPSQPHSDYLTVICGTEKHLIKSFIKVWSWMLPDIILGFNDGEYDWPWLKHRAELHGLLKFMSKSISQLWPSDYNTDPWTDKYILQRYYGSTMYKLDAETNISCYKFYFPGCIAIDVRTIFRQLFPNDEASSLNHYLTRLGIPTKLDVNFKDMFDMYQEMEYIENKNENDEIIYPEHLTNLMQQVAHYCVIDAQRCHELMLKLYVIMDKRAISDMSYVSFQDAIERANGMKVRNLIIAAGQQVPFLLKFNNNSVELNDNIERTKYPGAYVFPPIKGLVNGKLSIDERIINKLDGWELVNNEEIQLAKKVIKEVGAILSPEELTKYNFSKPINDFFIEKIKRPITGLDFNSLYPSLMMTYNLSPEYMILNKEIAREMSNRHNLYRIKFPFGNEIINGWIVRHDNHIDPKLPDFKFGIFGYVLKQLFDKRKSLKVQMKIWEKKSEEAKEGTQEYDDARFQYEYINSTQKALKIFMNTFYGEIGNQRSPFFMVQVAGGITINGGRNVKLAQQYVEKIGCKVYYGDSVTSDTPVILKDLAGNILIRTIDNIVSEKNWEPYPQFKKDEYDRIEKQQAFINTKLQIWAGDNWYPINKVIRHKTNKKMFRINTHIGCIDVTEDHSLLNCNLEKIKPSNCKIGDELYHSFPNEFNTTVIHIKEEEAWVWGFFAADGSCSEYNSSWTINNQNLDYLNQAIEYLKICEPEYTFKILESSKVRKLIPNGKVKKLVEKYKLLFYDKNNYKKVPDYIINSPIHIRRSFFNGYYIGDSCKTTELNDNIIEFCCKGKIWSQSMYYLIKSLGYKGISISLRNNKSNIYSFRITNSNYRKNPIAIKKIIELPPVTNDIYVYDIETLSGNFNAGIGELTLKNTDSIYNSMPDHYFLEIDKAYYSGEIDKLTYWSKLVEITLEVIAKIRDEINEYFSKDNGTNFLTMAFEEVLFPVLFASKKKYVGIAHEHHPSFAKPLNISELEYKFSEEIKIKFPEYTTEQIKNAVDDAIINKRKKQFFIRGLDVVKRGMPNFAKEIILDILEQMVAIDNIRELYDIVCDKINQIYKTEWNHPELLYKFIMTDQFKPHKKNQKMHVFVKRMFDEYNIIVKPFERVRYIIASKYPYRYDICGRQIPLTIGDKMELADIAIERNLTIDVDEYMQSKLFGQLGRLVAYRQEFLPTNYNTIDISDKDENKSLEDAIYSSAMKWVKNYSSQFSNKYSKLGSFYQKISKTATFITYSKLENLNTTSKRLFVPKTEDELEKLPEWIITQSNSYAKRKINKYAVNFINEFYKKYKTANNITLDILPKTRLKNPIYKSVKEYINEKLLKIIAEILPKYEKAFNKIHIELVNDLIKQINIIRDIYYKFNNMVQNASNYIMINYDLSDLYKTGINEYILKDKLESLITFITTNEDKISEQILFDNNNELKNSIKIYNNIFEKLVANNITFYKIKTVYDELIKNKNILIGNIEVDVDYNELLDIMNTIK